MSSIRNYREPSVRDLRSFGLIVCGAFSLIGAWPRMFRYEQPRLWAIVIALFLLVSAVIRPQLLRKVHHGWTILGNALGWINSKIVFGILFYVLFTPVRLIMKAAGRDPMNRAFDRNAASYRVVRRPRPASHMERQF